MDVNKVDGAMLPMGTSNPTSERELIPNSS